MALLMHGKINGKKWIRKNKSWCFMYLPPLSGWGFWMNRQGEEVEEAATSLAGDNHSA